MASARKPTNRAVVLRSAGDLRLEDIAIPEPGIGEVLISMRSVGICGSDVHYWVEGNIGDFVVKAPMVMGHESSGKVIALGEGVTDLQIGDRVAIEPGVPCRVCSYCKEGRYNLCPEIKFCATPPYNGSLCQYYVHAADFCHKLPDNVSYDEGALLEPLSVGIHASKRAGVTLASKVLICGAGPIGLVCLLTAMASGAAEVIVTDIDEGRLKVAQAMGAKYTIKVTTKDSKVLAKQIVNTLGCQPDQSIECSGVESSIAAAIYCTRSGGVLVLVGLGAAEAKLPIVDASVREVDIRGIFRYVNCYPIALEMVATGTINAKPLITHTYNLDQAVDAFAHTKCCRGGSIKVMIHCGEDDE
ncbi:hypothetical protein EMCRGX_G034936 [Ephydatia muelleri]